MTRRIIAVLISIVLAAAGTAAIVLYLRSADSRALAGKQARTVLVAATQIPAGITGRAVKEKGYVRHEPEGRAYRYFPTIGAERAGGSAIARIRDAIFHGSAERMFAQFVSDRKLGRDELERMRRMLSERLDEEEKP